MNLHPMSDFKIQVGNILAYYCYEAGNSLQTQHFYVDGVKKLTVPHADFIRVCDAIHAEHMVQGENTDSDESEENESVGHVLHQQQLNRNTDMSEQEALEALKELCERNIGDTEMIHLEADNLLCALLEKDYPNLVAQYKALPKWYA